MQTIIFGDRIPQANASAVAPTKIEPHAHAAIMGLSLLGSSIAAPALVAALGPMAIQQSRRPMPREAMTSAEDAAQRRSSNSADEGSASGSESDDDVGGRTVAQPVQRASMVARPSAPLQRPPKPKREVSYLPGAPLARPTEPFVPRGPISPQSSSSPPLSPRSRPPRPMTNRMPHTQSLSQLPSPTLSGGGSRSRQPSALIEVTPASPTFENGPMASAQTAHAVLAARPSHGIFANATASMSGTVGHHVQSASVPVLPLGRSSASQSTLPNASSSASDHAALVASLPRPLLVSMLRARACRAELDLLTTLQDISTRLIAVPKLARVSALRAELTVLNHGLPRGCCLCLFCPGEGGEFSPAAPSTPFVAQRPELRKPHHRVVRIAPSETVVLNSADRAPFLIHVEVLDGDLDFEPARRQNAEDLRIVTAERETALARQSYRSGEHVPRVPTPIKAPNPAAAMIDGLSKAMHKLTADPTTETPVTSPAKRPRRTSHARTDSDASDPAVQRIRPAAAEALPTPDPAPVSNEPEEVDLVEQLYGNRSMRENTPDPDAGGMWSPPIRNRTVDEETWQRLDRARNHSTPGSPLAQSSLPASPRPSLASAVDPTLSPRQKAKAPARPPITLDEYAERMRMAAVMLAQLNASQQAAVGPVSAAGGLVGAGLEAVRGRLPFVRRDSAQGQGSSGVSAKLDTAGAATGLSAVQGHPDSSPLVGSAASSPAMGRQRVLPPAEAAAIRERIMGEMMALESERMMRMQAVDRRGAATWTVGTASLDQDEDAVRRALEAPRAKDDPSGDVFREAWADKRARIRAASPFGHLASWDLLSLIVKTGADLRQEQLATQLIREFARIWSETGCPHWLR